MNKPTDIPPTMRYFTYDLIAAANDWVKQTPAQQRKAAAQFAAAVEKYQRELDSMKSRISRDAWQFFRYAYDEEGIHDARLLSLKVGDGLKYIAVSENWYSAKSA